MLYCFNSFLRPVTALFRLSWEPWELCQEKLASVEQDDFSRFFEIIIEGKYHKLIENEFNSSKCLPLPIMIKAVLFLYDSFLK